MDEKEKQKEEARQALILKERHAEELRLSREADIAADEKIKLESYPHIVSMLAKQAQAIDDLQKRLDAKEQILHVEIDEQGPAQKGQLIDPLADASASVVHTDA